MITPSEITQEVMAIRASFLYFLTRYVYILEPPPGQGRILWQPWPYLVELAQQLPNLNRLVILKARQLGLSWVLAAYAVYKAAFFPGAMVLLLSQGQEEARELLRKVRYVYSNLPVGIKPADTKNNESELQFGNIDSGIHALPATETAGTGYTATLVICDEHAKHPYAAPNYAALEPTINAGAQFISVSTAQGLGGFFHQLYTGAKANVNGYTWRFFNALMRPGRNQEWYDLTKTYYADTQLLFQQEYPINDTEAFIMTVGIPVFDLMAIEHLLQGTREPIATQTESLGRLLTYQTPRAGSSYVIGADVSYGLETPDASVAQVIEWRTGTHVASLHGHWPPDEFATRVVKLARNYNEAYLGVESNGVGKFCLRTIESLGYSSSSTMYYSDRLAAAIKDEAPQRIGWATTEQTRPVMIADLAQAIRGGSLALFDRETLEEMRTFIFDDHNKPQAAEGAHDDRVMALAIAWQMRQIYTAVPLLTGKWAGARSFMVRR